MTSEYDRVLKDGRAITVENKDVQRIRMFGDIVWEKIRETVLTLTSSTSSTSFVNSFTLTATLKDIYDEPVSGTIIFYDGENIIGSVETTTQNNISTATLTTSSTDIKTHQYYAVFEKTDKFKESRSQNISVAINKDTPKLVMLGTKTIYNTWKYGVQLQNSLGNNIKSKDIYIGTTKFGTTDKNGKVISTPIADKNGTMTIAYSFKGDTQYNAKTLTVAYTVKQYKSQGFSTYNVTGGQAYATSGTNKKYRPWHQLQTYSTSTKKFNYSYSECGVKNASDSSSGHPERHYIAGYSGTHDTPSPINIVFNTSSLNGTKTHSTKISCKHIQLTGQPAQNGGKPSIPGATLSSSIFTKNLSWGKPASYEKKGYDYAISTSKWTTSSATNSSSTGITNKTVGNSTSITCEYKQNTSGETGVLRMGKITLTINYIPKQAAL